MSKYKVIIDTDPGIDDCIALALAFLNKNVDIKLITTVSGNVELNKSTRNLLHLMDRMGINDIPVVRGSNTPLIRKPKYAKYIHGQEGMGNYIPPKTTTNQALDTSATDAMYKVITENPHEITILSFGPHTNIAKLLIEHPDASKLIKQIICEGGSPYVKDKNEYISFNVSSDPEALSIELMYKNIPNTIVLSEVGRNYAYFNDRDLKKLATYGELGEFLAFMLSSYVEKGRHPNNDACVLLYLLKPKYFNIRTINMSLDLTNKPGKTNIIFDVEHSTLRVIDKADREKISKYILKKIKKARKLKLK